MATPTRDVLAERLYFTDMPPAAADALLDRYAREVLAAAARHHEIEARPARHRWAVETRDPDADEGVPGHRFLNRHHAVDRHEALNESHPTWRDGTPVQRRLVRETTTYTVEQPAARPDADFAEVIGRCPEHGTRTETYTECRCAAARPDNTGA